MFFLLLFCVYQFVFGYWLSLFIFCTPFLVSSFVMKQVNDCMKKKKQRSLRRCDARHEKAAERTSEADGKDKKESNRLNENECLATKKTRRFAPAA